MDELRERIAGERRRLRKVREALSAAVAQTSDGDEAYVPFYLAIGEYFEAAMERLHTQDIRMGDLLREKADMNDPENQQILSELDRRLAGNQEHLKTFLAAKKTLFESGEEALEEYESAGRAYTNYITTNMGHHDASTELARNSFSDEDWTYMANISDEDMAREEELFERVFATMPARLNLTGEDAKG